jgi:flagellar basal body rod protein FlgG
MIQGILASLSGILNATQRLGLTANNIANQATPGYQALRATNVEAAAGGVRLAEVTRDESPGPPLPDFAGGPELRGSNVDPAVEQVNLLISRRQFEANVNALRAQDDTLGDLLDTLRD